MISTRNSNLSDSLLIHDRICLINRKIILCYFAVATLDSACAVAAFADEVLLTTSAFHFLCWSSCLLISIITTFSTLLRAFRSFFFQFVFSLPIIMRSDNKNQYLTSNLFHSETKLYTSSFSFFKRIFYPFSSSFYFFSFEKFTIPLNCFLISFSRLFSFSVKILMHVFRFTRLISCRHFYEWMNEKMKDLGDLSYLLLYFYLIYLARYANALLASAILCVSSFFFTAFHWLEYAARSSSASLIYIGVPFLLLEKSRIHFDE